MDRVRVGVIGCGYWGPNVIRNLAACPKTELVAVCDADPVRLEAVGRNYPAAARVGSLDQLLDAGVDAVAIATPVSTHFPLASQCLLAGKHVWVEKPLAASTREAQALTDLAARVGKVLMVDHTYLYTGAVRKVKELVDRGELGDLYYVDSVRINLGLFQHDVNVIWDLAPHDLSIIDYLLGGTARSISAWGCGHANPDTEDIAYVNIDYGDRLMASVHVNWLSPVKVRQMIFAGSRKSVIFNELNPTEPVKVYDRGIEIQDGVEEIRKLRVGYRSGDVWSPHVEAGEALQVAVSHFADCVRTGAAPLSDGRMGVRVVRLMEAATRSIKAQGGRIALTEMGVTNGHGLARAVRPGERGEALTDGTTRT